MPFVGGWHVKSIMEIHSAYHGTSQVLYITDHGKSASVIAPWFQELIICFPCTFYRLHNCNWLLNYTIININIHHLSLNKTREFPAFFSFVLWYQSRSLQNRERASALVGDDTRLVEPVSVRKEPFIVGKYDRGNEDAHSQEVGACKPLQWSCRERRLFVYQSDVSAISWRQYSWAWREWW